MMMTVIFDLDGTLLDTLDDLTAAVNHALRTMGRAGIDRSVIRRFVGNGVPRLITRALNYSAGREPDGECTDDFARCNAVFTAYYNEHSADRTGLYVGVAEMLAAVKSTGARTAVVTNKYDAAAQKLREKFFPGVDAVVGTSDSIRPKPAPDGVLRAIELVGGDIRRAVYVGDGETDIATAKNCGIPVIAVTWGFRDRAVLEGLCPDAMIDSPAELIPALGELMAKEAL